MFVHAAMCSKCSSFPAYCMPIYSVKRVLKISILYQDTIAVLE